MSTPVIQALSPPTILKIAAGEVIERPSNVVKELVENALDAGATKISVTVEEGGKELIRVADNGSGMTREDLLRCWLPHTTSKIRDAEDLDSVSSFGFRGEALASMASVSELTIETRHWEEEVGTRLRVTESRQEEVAEIARGPGATLTVRNLFRNNPVRRKFLGSAKAETARITTLLTRLSLAHPGTSFRIQEGTNERMRELLHLPEGTLRRRAGDVLGVHLLEDLIPVDWQGAGIHVQGYVSEPQRFSTRPSQQHFFVNRRHVYNNILNRALAQAYEAVPPGRHPVAALFVTMSPSEIDVNVHPAKREIRFLNEAGVFWSLSQALQRALRSVIDAPALELSQPMLNSPFVPETADGAGPSAASPAHAPRRADSEGEPAAADNPGFGAPSGSFAFSAEAFAVPASAPAEKAAHVSLFPSILGAKAFSVSPSLSSLEFTGAPCLQIHGSFILVAVRGGFLLVNQRAAHERILYEKAVEDLRRPGRFSAQQLLFPELVEFSAVEAAAVERHLAELRTLGFDLEPFGPKAFQLRGSPAEVAPEKAQGILQGITGRLIEAEGGRRKDGPEELLTRVARAYARAAAIPLDEPLDAAHMAGLIDGLFATQNPYVTPGGLPVLIRYSLDEIRRRFGLKPDEEE